MTGASLANLIAYSAQVLIVVATAAFAAGVVRMPMARARVAYWRLIVAACLALPLLAQPADRVVFTTESAGDVTTPVAVVDTGEVQPEPRVSAAAAVSGLLLAGAAARAAWLGIGILALIRLRRRSDVAVLPDDVEVLRKAVAFSTSIRWHAKIAQPVAFGWLRPVVLLPPRVADLPLDAQRAVVCHELLHVARRDWLWMLGEEAIRCLFWFHPAIWFALAKLQLSREELVDEEVVRITGVRQPYVRALAMFAGEPVSVRGRDAVHPAPSPCLEDQTAFRGSHHVTSTNRMRFRRSAGCDCRVGLGSGVCTVPLHVEEMTVLPLPRTGEVLPVWLPANRSWISDSGQCPREKPGHRRSAGERASC